MSIEYFQIFLCSIPLTASVWQKTVKDDFDRAARVTGVALYVADRFRLTRLVSGRGRDAGQPR